MHQDQSTLAYINAFAAQQKGTKTFAGLYLKSKLGVLRPVQQPGSYWDRSSAMPLVGVEPTQR